MLIVVTSLIASCSLPFAVVRDAEAAKKIALVAINASPNTEIKQEKYALRAEYLEHRKGWLVYQYVKGPVIGGGGIRMLISQCDGRISEIAIQR